MGARLYKEAREMAPLFLGTWFLIAVPYWVWGRDAGAFGFVALGVGCVLMAASSFGHEFQHRTLGTLLAQPVGRGVIWVEKMAVLAAALGLCALWLWLDLYALSVDYETVVLVLIPLCAFCGGPWLTLSSRSGIAGAVITGGFPGAIMTSTGLLLERWCTEQVIVHAIFAVLFVYCAAAGCLGYLTFKGLEFSDGIGRELGMPPRVEAWLGKRLGRLSGCLTGVFGSLVKKELRLQQFIFVAAASFVFAAVAGTILYQVRADWGTGALGMTYVIYMGLLPFLIGALAVAEERAWGLSEWHLSLPPSARKQWWAKSATALGLTFLLALVIPAAVFFATRPFLGGEQPMQRLVNGLHRIAFAQLLFTSVALYTGSFSKSTLRAILVALALALGLGCAVTFAVDRAQGLRFGAQIVAGPLRGSFMLDAGLVLLTVLLQRFALGHFRLGDMRLLTVARQVALLLVVTAVFGCGVAVYLVSGS